MLETWTLVATASLGSDHSVRFYQGEQDTAMSKLVPRVCVSGVCLVCTRSFFPYFQALGLVSAGTNNSRVAQLLRQLSEFYAREASHLFVTRIAQGLNHMGKVRDACALCFLCCVGNICTELILKENWRR